MKRALALLLLFAALPSCLHAASREPVRARKAMVSSTSAMASRIGIEIMQKGGNAVDAAVAVGFALAVTWPAAGNIGGGGFMLIGKADGTSDFIDYRGVSPARSTRAMFLDSEGNVIAGASTYGHKASAVPGTVAGLKLAHERHGKLPWAALIEPSRRLAAEGFVVSDFLAASLMSEDSLKRLDVTKESRRIFLRDGNYFKAGERLAQPELAATLARIAREPREFYEGETARLIVEEMQRHGGLLSREDLRSYRPIVRQPLRGMYRGHEILAPPPPSSGGTTLFEALNILEAYDLKAMGWNSSSSIHTTVEALRRAFADRAFHVADPAFHEVPVAMLLSKPYAAKRRATIDPWKASRSSDVGAGAVPQKEPTETTHYSVVDAEGTFVSNTYTINNWFGNGVTVPGTGILMNDDMDDFTVKPGVPNEFELIQGEANAIAPRKRPLSSMTPVILLSEGKPWLAVGSPGGPRIISTVLQTIINVIDFEMNVQQAVDAPRFHHQWMPDEIYWERNGINADTRSILERMGHRFRAAPEAVGLGEANAVMIDPKSGTRLGSADPRRDALAVGW
jgi:gamma-glutamyltranspeptidase / glutathione hydrolase